MTVLAEGRDGTVTVSDAVITSIAVRAAERIEGIRVRRRRSTGLEGGVVRLAIASPRGQPIVELAERVQEAVAKALDEMCGIQAQVELVVSELV